MKILAIDSATTAVSAAVIDETKLICESIIDQQLNHSRTLLPAIEAMLNNSGLNFKDLDMLAVSIGPGSFTGIRIGLATAKGLAQALKLKIIPVSTISSLSYNLLYSKGYIAPILDARRDQVYTALFEADGEGNIKRLKEDEALDFNLFLERIKSLDNPVLVLGDGLNRFDNILKEERNIITVEPFLAGNKASSLAAYALKHIEKAQDFHLVEPVYLRKSYAEEKK